MRPPRSRRACSRGPRSALPAGGRWAPEMAVTPAPQSGPSKRIAVVVNGQRRELTVASRQTLAELLREDLRLTGTKVGCNRAECGSCTVLMDGRPVFACSVLAVEARGRVVETVEGLEGPGGLHPLQAAFIEHDAV